MAADEPALPRVELPPQAMEGLCGAPAAGHGGAVDRPRSRHADGEPDGGEHQPRTPVLFRVRHGWR
jgi:hypothetical protein